MIYNPKVIRNITAEAVLLDKLEKLDDYFKVQLSYKDVPKLAGVTSKNSIKGAYIPSVFLLLRHRIFSKVLRRLVLIKRVQNLIDSAMIENRNLIEISTGCTEYCSYCAIKSAKGKLKSNSVLKILEAIQLIKAALQL